MKKFGLISHPDHYGFVMYIKLLTNSVMFSFSITLENQNPFF